MSDENPPDVLAALKATPIPQLSSEEEAARRARIIARIGETRQRLAAEVGAQQTPETPRPLDGGARVFSLATRWRRSITWASATLAAAAVLAVWVGREPPAALLRVSGGEVLVDTTHGVERLGPDAEWRGSGEVSVATEASDATVVLPSRTEVHLERASRARISTLNPIGGAAESGPVRSLPSGENGAPRVESVRLHQGALTVEKHESDEVSEFRVFTGRADVLMRGTFFAVMIQRSAKDDEVTQVVVREGEARVVTSGSQTTLSAGESWTSDRAAPELITDGANTSEAAAADSGPGAEPAVTADVPREPSKVTSSLGEQNRLFERAQNARRSGRAEEALRDLELLLRRYPGSEQAHNARVEHFRLLRTLGRHAQARRSAEAYLRAYPRGFAVDEARRLTR